MRDDRFYRVDHAHRAARFYEKLGYARPDRPGDVTDDQVKSIEVMLDEEIRETQHALVAGDVAGFVDGLGDVAFVAIGGLWKLGLSPDAVLAEVCRSNLTKEAAPTERLGRDAVKGPDYKPPRWCSPGGSLADFAGDPVRVPTVFVEAAALRQTKGRDYMSGGVGRADLNPFGELSYAHNVIEKALRLRSVIARGAAVDHEGARDTLLDLINYAAFMIEYLDGEVRND